MHLEHFMDGKSLNCVLHGRFTFSDHASFKVVVENIKEGKINQVLLDMKDVEFADSAALGMLLVAREEANKRKIKVILANATGQLEKMFKVSNFDTLFELRKA